MAKRRLPPLTKRMTDESDTMRFCFTFYCDCCGAGYRTQDIFFSQEKAPVSFKDFTNAQKLIWNAEHEDAYERGNRSALLVFTPCEECGKYICETCAGELETDTLCPACRQKRAQT